MIKAVFFDMAGVICEERWKEAIAKYEKELGMPDGELYKAVHDHQGWKDFTLGYISETEFLSQCKQRANVPNFDGNILVRYILESIIPNLEMVQYIRQLDSKGLVVGIISNNPKEWFDRFLKSSGLAEVVRIKAISSYLHIRKPKKEIFEAALKEAGVKPEEAVYIDDRPDRVEGAEELGIGIILFDGNIENLKNKIAQSK